MALLIIFTRAAIAVDLHVCFLTFKLYINEDIIAVS